MCDGMFFSAQPGQCVHEVISVATPVQNKAVPLFCNTEDVVGGFLFVLLLW